MRSITFEGKKINFDFSLGSINDVYVKELGGDFNDLINMQEYENNPSKLIEVTRDMMLSGHIYYLYCNGEDQQADALVAKIKTSKMIATKWLMQTQVITVVEWITKDLMPSDLDAPKATATKKK
ncbi:MAG: hypothetical protein RL621_540 [Bacteroidota bacterium]|jgi:hypothetical protein